MKNVIMAIKNWMINREESKAMDFTEVYQVSKSHVAAKQY